MRRVFTIGETVMDIVFKNDVPVAAKAGGSMLNASVTLGRLNIPVSFISEYGKDKVGDIINIFLAKNRVDTSFIHRYSEGKSAVALAFLDENQNATYDFYKIYPTERLKIPAPDFTANDIVMFGSYFGISTEVRPALVNILAKAREKGAIIIYDPNFRKAHLHQLNELFPLIIENILIADIIKGSDEDFLNIFGVDTAQKAFEKFNDTSKILIYSRGEKGAHYHSAKVSFHVGAKVLQPVSTIGAGDNFTAGLAFGLIKNNVSREGLLHQGADTWKHILKTGVDFASEVCLSYENYIPVNYASDYLRNN